MTIKIEKGVPAPKRGPNSVYPWHQMEIGDSFAVPFKEGDGSGAVTRARLLTAGASAYKARGRVRTAIDGDKVRIWRIA